MKKACIKEGINLYTVCDKKFKTMRACVMLHRPLSRDEVTKNTLLVSVMRMQCEKFKSSQEISVRLEELYGADLIARASKYGERQIIKLGIQTVADSAVGENNFKNAMELLLNMLLSSGTGKSFSEDIVQTEKKNIKDAILAQKNDKRSYSVLRLQQEMCNTEAYGINPMGYTQDLESIDAKGLYSHYKKILSESRIDIIFTGNFEEESALEAAKELAAGLCARTPQAITEKNTEDAAMVRRITDKMDVTQGKLCMGFRMKGGAGRERYPETIVFNTVFGGSATSKLFENVREKLSLCYYVSSSIDRLKEIMIVRSGVEFENFEKAQEEIMLQLEKVCSGDITPEEEDAAKKQLVGAYTANCDSEAAMEEYCIMQILLGTDVSVEDMIESIKNVRRGDIARAARECVLDTVYCIEGE